MPNHLKFVLHSVTATLAVYLLECYYSIVSAVLGKEWLNKELFRFGVSRVANNILAAVEQKTVSYF